MEVAIKPKLVIDYQTYEADKKWILSKYCEVIKYKDYYCLYNSLVGSVILLTPEEYQNILKPNEQNFFVKYWFIVPEDKDMVEIAKQVRRILTNPNAKKGKTNTFIILTSTACNARCWYCFECVKNVKSMTVETAKDVVQFMLRKSNGKPIHIKWFGGEPMVNHKVMDTICNELTSLGIEYQTTMISNLSLFDDASIIKCKTLWNLNHIQVTLDGVGDVYNSVKNYVNFNGDPFTYVVDNIKKLAAVGVKMTIRVNWSVSNFDNVCQLIDYYQENIEGTKNIALYLAPLTQEFSSKDEEFSKQWFDVFLKLRERYPKLCRSAFGSGTNRLTLSYHRCQVDSDAMLILPDGKLGICDQHLEELMGDIYSDDYDFEKITKFGERNVDPDVCYDCKIFPKCNRLKVCGYNHCTKYTRQYGELGLKYTILNEVKKYLKKKIK